MNNGPRQALWLTADVYTVDMEDIFCQINAHRRCYFHCRSRWFHGMAPSSWHGLNQTPTTEALKMPNKVGGRPYHYLSMAAKGAREAPFFVAAQRIGVEHFDVATSGALWVAVRAHLLAHGCQLLREGGSHGRVRKLVEIVRSASPAIRSS